MTMPSDKELSQLREKLRVYEQKYYALFNETNDAVFLMDLNGIHLEMNERAASMLGYTVEELKGLSFRDIVHEEELSNAESRLAEMMRGETLPLYERTFRHKDGTLVQVELDVALIRDNEDTPLYIQSIARDISQRKGLERSLQESEELYRLLAENAKDIIATIDMDLRLTYVSPSVKATLGFEAEELISKSITDLLTPDSLALVNNAFEEALHFEQTVGKDGYEAPPLEVETYHKNGATIWVEVSRVFLRDEEDKPTGVLIIVRDIMKRKNVEKALQSSERRYREMIETNPEGIGILDFNEEVLFSNKAFANMLGYEPDEIEGMSVLDFLSPESIDRIRSETQQGAEGSSSTYQVEMKTKAGDIRIMRISAVPWRNDEGEITGAISVITDITEGVQTENELAASNRDLELYTSLLRHDLRNDLQIILAQADAVSMLLPKDSDLIKVCEVTRNAAVRMKQLINAFEIPEEQLTDNVMTLLETRARHAEKAHYGLQVAVRTREDASTLRVARGRLLPALFDNLLRNSYQHAGPDVKVEIVVSIQEGSVQIDMTDSGPGIPEVIRSKVFEKGISTLGKGQGLYLCRRIAEAYGGSIKLLEDSPSKGAPFRVILPMS